MLDGDSLARDRLGARAGPRDRAGAAGAAGSCSPLVETANFVTIALLPDRIRDEYGFSPLPPAFVRKALVRAGGEYVKRAVVPFLPERLRLAAVRAARRAKPEP